MKQVYFREGVLMYYGNPAGYLLEEKAVIDSMFDKKELRDYLKSVEKLDVVVKEGIYDRLSRKGITPRELESVKDCVLLRIHQLKKDTPILLRFISLAEREKRGYGKPAEAEYETVYEAETDTIKSIDNTPTYFSQKASVSQRTTIWNNGVLINSDSCIYGMHCDCNLCLYFL